MLLQLGTWAIVSLVLFGIGTGALRAASAIGGVRRSFQLDGLDRAWLGLAIVIAFLQLASLAGPIGDACAAIAAAASLPGVYLALRRRWTIRPRTIVAVALATAAALVVAHAANGPVSFGDTCASHIQQVMWARDHGAVIGLGNLSVKFALDQSAHLFAALLDRGVWRDASLRVAVPFLVWLTLAQWAATLVRAPRSAGDARARIYCALTLPFLISALRSRELPSFSGDLAMGCAVSTLLRAVVRLPFVERARLRRVLSRHAYECWLIACLGALVATLKLSGALCTLLGLAVLVGGAATLGRRWLATASLIPLTLFAGMIGRRIVLSGWLLFPAPLGNLHLPWSLPTGVALGEYRYIRAWARLPLHDPSEVLDHGLAGWFGPWLARFQHSVELRVFLVALLLLIARAGRPRGRTTPLEAGALATALLSIAYWFASAPDVRFGAVFFWMLLAIAAAPLVSAADRRWLTTVVVVAGVATSALVPPRGELPAVPQPRALRWLHVTPVEVHYETEPQVVPDPRGPPLVLHVPRWGRMFCGDSPLPCTPFPTSLRLREVGRLGSGFLPAP